VHNQIHSKLRSIATSREKHEAYHENDVVDVLNSSFSEHQKEIERNQKLEHNSGSGKRSRRFSTALYSQSSRRTSTAVKTGSFSSVVSSAMSNGTNRSTTPTAFTSGSSPLKTQTGPNGSPSGSPSGTPSGSPSSGASSGSMKGAKLWNTMKMKVKRKETATTTDDETAEMTGQQGVEMVIQPTVHERVPSAHVTESGTSGVSNEGHHDTP